MVDKFILWCIDMNSDLSIPIIGSQTPDNYFIWKENFSCRIIETNMKQNRDF